MNQKNTIRQKILTLLRTQKEEDRLKKSKNIAKQLFRRPEFKSSKTILFYAAFDGEVDTSEMIKQAQKLKKRVALPKVNKSKKSFVPILIRNLRDLIFGAYGIREPKHNSAHVLDSSGLDLVIVPAVAFDRENHRLGRGGGYYDRFLEKLPSGIPTLGLAFDFQIVDRLPRKQHDLAVDRVIFNN